MNRIDDTSLLGFHLSKEARDIYHFSPTLITFIGKSLIDNFLVARQFAQFMNDKRDLVTYPEQAIPASEVNAMALIQGLMQGMFRAYCQQYDPLLLNRLLNSLEQQLGQEGTWQTLDKYVELFPPTPVYQGELEPQAFLMQGPTAQSHRLRVLEELLMLWLANANPAFNPYGELFSDDQLVHQTSYTQLIQDAYQYFGTMANTDIGEQSIVLRGMNILDVLLAPSRQAPYSLEDQLNYILTHWSSAIEQLKDARYRLLLMRSADLIREESKPMFGFPAGPGPSVSAESIPIPTYENTDLEFEKFTIDREWMPQLVLLAKNAFVWLDQLSKQYQRTIRVLSDIPDEELDQLARWGITGLWLIGLWERSRASKVIKQMCGNPDAVASAYSLYNYQIAEALGGEPALDNLRQRAWQRGIRLASDMVPNHTGIDGRWTVEHPDWYIQLDHSPFPSYTFDGPNLSWDDRVEIYLEDHYYNQSDAAVVFKHVDRRDGQVRYIYHGNDGTTMPWNDTAQLDYLKPEVREAMIQLILHICRQFPVVRFDAAMTLVKRHFHRLWYPEPGSGGAIASRAEHGITRPELDELMPIEFWREVVDRAAVEAPDTLLLAEAFWLMESYFVRTLGMHRVYNSAFMNILRDEDNAKYRTIMKNTLEFDPEILRRWVNFLNNPDEKTAVEQFGKDNKYFGVTLLMVTLPGLPMLGHGQIEGYAEKYGMEYYRAYYDETPDHWLIGRHEHDIFPLTRKRYLFAGVEQFLLFDWNTGSDINENVYAYFNRVGDESAIVLYHNANFYTRGTLHHSVAYSVKTGHGDERTLIQRTLGEGLGLDPSVQQYIIAREYRTDNEYLWDGRVVAEHGLTVDLGAYEYKVFWEFRLVTEDEHHPYGAVYAYLNGRGVPSVEEAAQELLVQEVSTPFRALVNAEMFQRLYQARVTDKRNIIDPSLLREVEQKYSSLVESVIRFNNQFKQAATIGMAEEADELLPLADDDTADVLAERIRGQLAASLSILQPARKAKAARQTQTAAKAFIATPSTEEVDSTTTHESVIEQDAQFWSGIFGWLFVYGLGDALDEPNGAQRSRAWIDEWLLSRALVEATRGLGLDTQTAKGIVQAIKVMTAHQQLFMGQKEESADVLISRLLNDADMQQFLQVNRFEGKLWFNREAFNYVLRWLAAIPIIVDESASGLQRDPQILRTRMKTVTQLQRASEASGYQIDQLQAVAKAEVEVENKRKPAPKRQTIKSKPKMTKGQ